MRTFIFLLLISGILLPSFASAEEEYWEYTFRPGDSIWSLAKRYTTTVDNWYEIQKLNKISQGPDLRIKPGTRIIIPVSMLKHQPSPAEAIAVTGSVRLTKNNGDIVALVVGTKLYSGDSVETGKKQYARIMFADKSDLQISPNSNVVLDKLSIFELNGMVDTRMRLNAGSATSNVNKRIPASKYFITTPASVTAVRGTSFRLSATDDISKVEVTGGNVDVSTSLSEKNVRTGYGIIAEKDKALSEPVKLLEQPVLTKIMSADNTAVELKWVKLDGAQSYRYQLASDENFNNIINNVSTTSNGLNLPDLAMGTYYFRVRGIDSLGLEGIDSNTTIDIHDKPPIKPLDPPDMSKKMSLDQTEAELKWQKLDGAQSYRYQIASDRNFSDVIIDNRTDSNEIEISELDAGKYFISLSGIDSNGIEGIAATDSFFINRKPPTNYSYVWGIITPILMVLLFGVL